MDGMNLASQGQSRWFEDFSLGERFELPTRTMTEAMFRLYSEASGESHPLHSDDDYGRAQGLPGMMAHGFQVLIQTTAGAGEFHSLVEESLIGLIEQSSRFRKPVFVGDVLQPILQVVELAPNIATGEISLRSTVHNQRGELVLEGAQRFLLRRRKEGVLF
jgi:acyl dehydratase